MVKPLARDLRAMSSTYPSPWPNPANGPLRGLMKPTFRTFSASAA
jgi:hypothetical protein